MEDFVGEAKILHKEENQGLDYRGEMYENLMQEVNGIQHSPSLISSAYTTHEEGKFPSQLHLNENEEQTDNPLPFH